MAELIHISDSFIESHTDFNELIELIRQGFSDGSINTPMRHHHDFENPVEEIDSTLLLMPSWDQGKDLGVKMVTVSPNNGKYGLPSIQGIYIYWDAHKGGIKAILDAKALTAKRTAAASALAASYLAKKDASTMLMIGTGALSPNLIKAHASVRPIKEVFLWGRDIEKAQKLAEELSNAELKVVGVADFESYLSEVDLISCATLSPTALVRGELLRPGQHLDLVGSYRKDTREADDQAIEQSSVYLDTYQGGLKETGDIVIPLKKGILTEARIKADLFELCSGLKTGRESEQEITLFKSVGHASEDLVGARYYYGEYRKRQASK